MKLPKRVVGKIKIYLPAGKATPGPWSAPLGMHGVNIMEFCRAFNEQTKDKGDVTVPIELTVFEDRSFSFICKNPPASELLKKAAGVEKGSGQPHQQKIGKISKSKILEIAKLKMPDLNALDLEGAAKIIEGTAKSMGLEVVD